MDGTWNALGAAREAATTGAAAFNAAIFAERARQGRGARRLASLLLVALFASIAIDAGWQLLSPGSTTGLPRLPLLAANAAIALVLMRGRRP